MHTLRIAALLIALGSTTALAQNQPEPAKETTARNAKPDIYDVKADARQQIAAAVAKAQKNNRRVLIQWGANWCGWCHLLHEAMASDKNLKHELLYEYDVVLIDIGRFDKHMDVAESYGADLKSTGVPYLTVLDSSGKAIANQETGSLESKEPGKHEHDRAAVLKFLTDHQASPRSADAQLQSAIASAKSSGKVVFLHFGAPWCGWCHKLESWMERPEIAAILNKAFVDVKIDVDRDTSGKELARKFKPDDSGIPWFAFLDGSGKTLATSDGPKGNTGFPSAKEELEHFEAMLTKASGLNSDEIRTLIDSLKAAPAQSH